MQIKTIEKKLEIQYKSYFTTIGTVGLTGGEINASRIAFQRITFASEPPINLRPRLAGHLTSGRRNDTIVSRECKEIMGVRPRSRLRRRRPQDDGTRLMKAPGGHTLLSRTMEWNI
jgi:hypothetical protein